MNSIYLVCLYAWLLKWSMPPATSNSTNKPLLLLLTSAALPTSELNINKWSQTILSRYYGTLCLGKLWAVTAVETSTGWISKINTRIQLLLTNKGKISLQSWGLRLPRTSSKLPGTLQPPLTSEEGKRPRERRDHRYHNCNESKRQDVRPRSRDP